MKIVNNIFYTTLLPPILCVSFLIYSNFLTETNHHLVKSRYSKIAIQINFLMDNDNDCFFCIFLYCRIYNDVYLCINKARNMTQITIRLMIPILRLAMLANYTQNWREHCILLFFLSILSILFLS